MKWLRITGALLGLFLSNQLHAQTATVTWANVRQRMDGFGASTGTGYASNIRNGPISMTNAEAAAVYNASTGAGLTLVRALIWPDGTYPDNPVLKNILAQDPDVRVWATSWSPPAEYKTSGTVYSCTGPAPAHYTDFANYLVNWVQHQNANGVPIYGISLQNEPDYCTGSTGHQPFSTWNATNFHDFIVILGPLMASNGLGNVKIIAPETSNYGDLPGLTDACLNDSNCAKYISVAASHQYSGNIAAYDNAYNKGKHIWETEAATFETPFDPSITNALKWAMNIHSFLTTANASAWHYWLIKDDAYCDNETLLSGGTCSGGPGAPSKRLWMMGNWSKFVRPGWVRVDATVNPQGNIYMSAFKETSTGNFAIVVINRNGSSIEQTVNLSGFNASSVTPWITSSSLSLAEQSDVSVANASFSYSLPANSITTFVGSAGGGTGSSNRPNAPSGLVAVVH